MDRSRVVKSCRPYTNENLGNSSSIVWRKSIPPKGPGFLGNVHQPRVSRS